MKTTSHTPTPWKATAGLIITSENGSDVAETMRPRHGSLLEENEAFDQQKANAAFIVRAVNSHDALVSIAKMIAGCKDFGELHMDELQQQAELALSLANS